MSHNLLDGFLQIKLYKNRQKIPTLTRPKASETLFSYEFAPPPRGRSVQDIIDIVKALVHFNPPWIDVTAHSAGAFYNEKADGTIERKIIKKRPETIGICGIIQNRFKIDTVATF